MVQFNDDWYFQYRTNLLSSPQVLNRSGHREVAFALKGSACEPIDQKYVEGALKKLSPRHASSVRGHMQFYRACLEAIAIVPPDPVVRSAVEIEWLWYSTPFKDFYRDHLAHVQKVTALADFLVTSRDSPLCRGSTIPLDWIAQGMAERTLGNPALRHAARRCGVVEVDGDAEQQRTFWRCALHTSLRYAGLLHDMAYPSVMVHKVRKAAEPNSPFPAFKVLNDGRFESSYHLFAQSLCNLPYQSIEDESDKKAIIAHALDSEHNVQGALRVLQYGIENNATWRLSSFEAFCLEWASLAILMHDFDKPFGEVFKLKAPVKPTKNGRDGKNPTEEWYRQLAARLDGEACFRPRFQDDPASYLLAFADQLQDFGRLNYTNQTDPSNLDQSLIASTYPFRSVSVDVDKNQHAKIDFQYSKRWKPDGLKDDRKQTDAQKIFEGNSWLDHTGLFASVAIDVTQET